MTSAPSAPVSAQLRMPVWRFEQYGQAIQAADRYQVAMGESAAGRRSKGLSVTDQDQPEEVFCLAPARPVYPPLVIVGGMGPLAGAMAFRRACGRFRNSRTVVLYQACSTPDRSGVILRDAVPDAALCREIAMRLAEAVRLAVGLAGQPGQPVRCILACNTAHYFWSLMGENLRTNTPECAVEMVSLVQSSVDALKRHSGHNTLLLGTEGARVGRVFSEPFREAGIAFEEPSVALGHLLMRAIFEGIKSLDERRAVALGNQFFEAILRTGRHYDCVLAGCTELPLTINLLRLRGSSAVATFLSQLKIVDPLEEAICRC